MHAPSCGHPWISVDVGPVRQYPSLSTIDLVTENSYAFMPSSAATHRSSAVS